MFATTSPRVRNRRRGLELAPILVALLGCSPQGAAPSDGEAALAHCEPGDLAECACTNGSTGMQLCLDTGTYATCGGCGTSTTDSNVPPTSSTSAPTSPTSTSTAPTPTSTSSAMPTATSTSEPAPTSGSSMDASTPPPEPEPEPVPDPVDVPAGDYCAPVATWDPLWVQWEEEVLLLVNERRAQGASCGTQGTFPPAAPLTMNANLRCAARLHSMDMAVRNFFEHSNPDGLGPGPRIQAAGYSGGTMGENIAAGQSSPEAVVDAWMGSDGHCSNIMQSIFTDIGVGYYYESARPSHYWTEEFGGPGWRG